MPSSVTPVMPFAVATAAPSTCQWLCMGLFLACSLGVFIWLLVAFIRFWQRDQGPALPGHTSMTRELVWMIIPFLILVALAWPALHLMLSAG